MIEHEDMIRILGCIPLSDRDQLTMISQAISSRRHSLNNEARNSFKQGDRVSFRRRKSGEVLNGYVLKINRKTIGVMTDTDGEWRVYPNNLTMGSLES